MRRFEIYWVQLDPTTGSEIKKTRPCVIVSPDEMNRHLQTVIVAPITSTIKDLPFRIKIKLKQRAGSILLDQIRTIDKSRLVGKISVLNTSNKSQVLAILQEMFAE